MTTTPQPLAARMRPRSLDEIVGQSHLLAPGSPLRSLASTNSAVSLLLWGPPGVGKTSIAQAIALETAHRFIELSATSAGVKEVREVITSAQKLLDTTGQRTLLFLDEIHRFSKAQQDTLLPVVETGIVSLIGATTENPSFAVNSALNSRTVLLVLRPLEEADLVELISHAIQDPRGYSGSVQIDDDAKLAIAKSASGDARQALTLLEAVVDSATASSPPATIDVDFVSAVAPQAIARYDRDGDQHYDIVSAFIKSLRGSDPDAALYWLAKMIVAGEDPRFIARRLIVHASEDVGMADPTVLPVAVAAAQAVQLVGLPEARINLAQATIAIAVAPKSNAAYRGIDAAIDLVKRGGTHQVPKHLRDSHYKGAKALGHGEGYLYPHNFQGAAITQQYLPDALVGTQLYNPSDNGREASITRSLAIMSQLGELNANS